MLETAPPFPRVRQVAVVRQGEIALVAVDNDRLRVQNRTLAGSRVSGVADRSVAGKTRQCFGSENLLHQAHALDDLEMRSVAGGNSRRFLAAVLQGVKAQVRQFRCLGMAEYTHHAAMVVEMFVIDEKAPHVSFIRARGGERRVPAPENYPIGLPVLTSALE